MQFELDLLREGLIRSRYQIGSLIANRICLIKFNLDYYLKYYLNVSLLIRQSINQPLILIYHKKPKKSINFLLNKYNTKLSIILFPKKIYKSYQIVTFLPNQQTNL